MNSISYRLLLVLFLVSIPLITASCTKAKGEQKVEPKKIGVQVYSVRNELRQDFKGTLEQLSKIGYTYIEAYGMQPDGTIYGMSPEEYKQTVEDLGMELVSAHSTYFAVEEAPAMIEAAKAAGLDYVIIPYLGGEQREDYDAVAKNLNEVGALFREAGIGFGYHNHNFEFEALEDGRIPMEILIEGTNPENVKFQADLYWIANAGFDPVAFVNKYPGRFASFHVKDADAELNQTTVGTGIVDFKTILGDRDKSGIDYYFVEDERTDDPLANLKAAFDYLQELNY